MSQPSPRGRFVLKYGVLWYGGGLFVVFNALHVWRVIARGDSLAGLPLLLVITAVFCPLAGGLFGLLMWRRFAGRAKR